MHIQIFDKSSNLQEVADQKPPQREDAEDKKVKASFWSPIINSTRKHQTPIIYQRDDHLISLLRRRIKFHDSL